MLRCYQYYSIVVHRLDLKLCGAISGSILLPAMAFCTTNDWDTCDKAPHAGVWGAPILTQDSLWLVKL